MGNWISICRNFTDENNQLTKGYYAEIASDEGVKAHFLFGNAFAENEENVIKQAYDYIREYMPEYDASEINVRLVEGSYRAYGKIFVNEGFDAHIERELFAHITEMEGFVARAYDSLHAQEQGDFIDEFTLAVRYDIEELSDEAFIKGAIEYLRPTLMHKKEQVNTKQREGFLSKEL